MRVSVVSRSGREVIKGGIEHDDSAMVGDLHEVIHKWTKKFYPSRQRLTLPLKPGSKEKLVVLGYKESLRGFQGPGPTGALPSALLLRVLASPGSVSTAV